MNRTRWEDWYAEVDRAFRRTPGDLRRHLPHGAVDGCLPALRLAELHGDAIRGLVLVNPSVTADTKLFPLRP
jgi:carboxylesterase